MTQAVRPLLAAALGASFDDPVGEEFVASGAFVADALRQPVWDDEPLRAGVDLWLRVHALAGPFTTAQVQAPARARPTSPDPPSLRSVVQQVLAATWTSLDLCASRWVAGEPVRPPATLDGPGRAPGPPGVGLDGRWPAPAGPPRVTSNRSGAGP